MTWHMQLALIWRPNRNARRCTKGERRERARNNAVPAVNAPWRPGGIELRSAAGNCRLSRNRGDFEGRRPLSRARRAFNYWWLAPRLRNSWSPILPKNNRRKFRHRKINDQRCLSIMIEDANHVFFFYTLLCERSLLFLREEQKLTQQ